MSKKAHRAGKAFSENLPENQTYLSPDDVEEVTPEHLKKIYENLTPIQQRIVLTKRKYPGLHPSALARMLGIKPASLSREFRARELEKINEWLNRDVFSKLEYLQIKALNVLNDLLENSDPWIRLSASQTLTRGLVDAKQHIPHREEILNLLITDTSKKNDIPEELK